MRFTIFAATLALVYAVFAQSDWSDWFDGNGNDASKPGSKEGNGLRGEEHACLNSTSVIYLLNGYQYLLEHSRGPTFNATANGILSDRFFVSSDSINSLARRPVESPFYLNLAPR